MSEEDGFDESRIRRSTSEKRKNAIERFGGRCEECETVDGIENGSDIDNLESISETSEVVRDERVGEVSRRSEEFVDD